MPLTLLPSDVFNLISKFLNDGERKKFALALFANQDEIQQIRYAHLIVWEQRYQSIRRLLTEPFINSKSHTLLEENLFKNSEFCSQPASFVNDVFQKKIQLSRLENKIKKWIHGHEECPSVFLSALPPVIDLLFQTDLGRAVVERCLICSLNYDLSFYSLFSNGLIRFADQPTSQSIFFRLNEILKLRMLLSLGHCEVLLEPFESQKEILRKIINIHNTNHIVIEALLVKKLNFLDYLISLQAIDSYQVLCSLSLKQISDENLNLLIAKKIINIETDGKLYVTHLLQKNNFQNTKLFLIKLKARLPDDFFQLLNEQIGTQNSFFSDFISVARMEHEQIQLAKIKDTTFQMNLVNTKRVTEIAILMAYDLWEIDAKEFKTDANEKLSIVSNKFLLLRNGMLKKKSEYDKNKDIMTLLNQYITRAPIWSHKKEAKRLVALIEKGYSLPELISHHLQKLLLTKEKIGDFSYRLFYTQSYLIYQPTVAKKSVSSITTIFSYFQTRNVAAKAEMKPVTFHY